MGNFGMETYDSIGSGITVSADGDPKAKAGGITIDWGSVTASLFSSTTYLDSDTVVAGEKYIRYGTVMQRVTGGTSAGMFVPSYATVVGGGSKIAFARGDAYILNRSVHENDRASNFDGAAIEGGRVYLNRIIAGGAAASQTYTLTYGDATGGTYTLSFDGKTTAPIAFGAVFGTVDTALEAISSVGTGNVAVTGTAPNLTVTFGGTLANIPLPALTVDGSALTGGVSAVTRVPALVQTVAGKYLGPTTEELNSAFPMVTFVTEN